MDTTTISLIIAAIAGAMGILSRFIPSFETDNAIEEVAEKIIKEKTNLDIDLSPDTPDPDKK